MYFNELQFCVYSIEGYSKRRALASKNRRVVTERRRSASSGLVNLRSSSRAPLKIKYGASNLRSSSRTPLKINCGVSNFGTIRTVASVPNPFGKSQLAYSSFVPKERAEGSVLLDFFVTCCSHFLLFSVVFTSSLRSVDQARKFE